MYEGHCRQYFLPLSRPLASEAVWIFHLFGFPSPGDGLSCRPGADQDSAYLYSGGWLMHALSLQI